MLVEQHRWRPARQRDSNLSRIGHMSFIYSSASIGDLCKSHENSRYRPPHELCRRDGTSAARSLLQLNVDAAPNRRRSLDPLWTSPLPKQSPPTSGMYLSNYAILLSRNLARLTRLNMRISHGPCGGGVKAASPFFEINATWGRCTVLSSVLLCA